MSTTRTATRLTVAASLLIALVSALLPRGSASAEETPGHRV
nr:MAG TPA: cystatin [Caudoviricetes sp.]